MSVNTNDTLKLVKEAQGQPNDALAKAITQATGLVAYDLRAPALSLVPVLTPLRNRLPRVGGEGGTAINWNAITAINSGKTSAVVSEGNRGGMIATTVTPFVAAYKGIGLEDSVTFEADYAGVNYQDAKATAALNLLRAVMIAEEALLFGGNSSMALGTTPTPTLATATAGGAIATGTAVSVICVALAHDGYSRASLAGGLVAQIAKTNVDATVDTVGGGVAQKSAAATVTTGAGSTNVVTGSVAVVPGAVAYAWYAGTAGAERLAAITTINSVVLTALPGASQLASALPAADNSTNALAFDGLLTFASKAANGGYVAAMPTGTAGAGTPLTSDGAAGIVELTAAFRFFWDMYRLSPDRILVNAQEQQNIAKKVIAGGGAPLFRFTQGADAAHVGLTGGLVVKEILNPITGTMVQVEVHPNAAPGTLLFEADTVPYPLSGVANVKEVVCRRDYYQLEWPLRTRKYEYGVYADQVLRVKVPFTLGTLSNIGNG